MYVSYIKQEHTATNTQIGFVFHFLQNQYYANNVYYGKYKRKGMNQDKILQ